ncbi:hypothetical protein ACI3QN_13340, partial [Propionibacterium freudenreichii]|uniref:hypothetical protein n=1 Tax=Propionibacterium freudenreichii TaxID=1744 RepID=UPI0038518EF7
IKEVSDKLKIDWDASDFLYDVFGRDVTYKDGYAKPETMSLFYYNNEGVKSAVEITIKDLVIKNGEINSCTKIPKFWED